MQTSLVDSDQTLTQILSSDLQHSVTCTSESVDDSPLFILVSPPDVKFCSTVSADCPRFSTKTKSSWKSYFAGPAKKKQKDINGEINMMIEARRTVLEAKSALADETSKQQAQLHELRVKELINKEKRENEIHQLLVQERKVDLQIKNIQLCLLQKQPNESN